MVLSRKEILIKKRFLKLFTDASKLTRSAQSCLGEKLPFPVVNHFNNSLISVIIC